MKEALHILLAEDNLSFSSPVEKMLAEVKQIGGDIPDLKVTHIENLQEGLAYLNTRKIDAVLLELDLSSEQAEETLISVQEHSPNIPIVILSREYSPEQSRLASLAGVTDLLSLEEVNAPLLVDDVNSVQDLRQVI